MSGSPSEEESSSPTSTMLSSASPPQAGQSVLQSAELDALVFVYMHECVPAGCCGYSLYLLDLDFIQPSEAVRTLPDPILLFGNFDEFPYGMGFFMSGLRLYMIGGILPGGSSSTATYYIDLETIPVLPTYYKLLVKRGPDMTVGRIVPHIFSVGEMFYVISSDLYISSCFEMFDPKTETWTVLPDELSPSSILRDSDKYEIESYMVDSASIYLSTQSGIFVFDTDSAKWTTPKDVMGVTRFYSGSGCLESSQFYIACSLYQSSMLVFPKYETNWLAKPIVDDADLLGPYKEHVEYYPNQSLLQVSKDRFCYICEGYDSSRYDYFGGKEEKKHIIIHVFDLIQHVSLDGGSLHSGDYSFQHQDLSRVLYSMDNSLSDHGKIFNIFLINHNNLECNASKRLVL